MRKLFLLLSLGVFLFSCKEAKKETKPSPYQALADQYAEFPLTTDLSQLTENEKKMIPILIEVADIMENIFWQNAYGDKSALMAQFAQDSAALKYLSINYGPWDRLNDNKPFIDGVGAGKPAPAPAGRPCRRGRAGGRSAGIFPRAGLYMVCFGASALPPAV